MSFSTKKLKQAAASAAFSATALALLTAPVFAHGVQKNPPLVLKEHGYFFAGGHYVPADGDQIMTGQIYVEYFVPAGKTQKYPVVMIYGGGQTGTNFLETPDGREGWAHNFVRAGYTVYVIDQAARGRSAYHPDVNGPTGRSTAMKFEHQFTAPETFSDTWPQAHFHTQWPGTGLAGDPVFDQFYASQVEFAGNGEALTRDAVAALLDKIGPAIILTHSQSGSYGWVIADARPNLVKAVVALEPSGPPFENAPPPWSNGSPARAWGVTSEPMAYDPPITDPSQLQIETVPSNDPDLVSCKRQQEPAHKLAHLLDIPVLVFSSEASYHAGYDYCTANYLEQAGVDADYIRLPDVGLPGNGHMVMLEKNSAKVADFMMSWLSKNLGRHKHQNQHYSYNGHH